MISERSKVIEAADFLKQRLDKLPQIGFLTGTGLADTLHDFNPTAGFPYDEIPHFPVSTVESHTGQLSFGKVHGRVVMMMQGRFHLYEGYTPKQVCFPIRVMQEMGIKLLILSNAAGGLNPGFSAGDIMLISDHINLTGKNPLAGPNEDAWGLRFPDMSEVYDKGLRDLAEEAARKMEIPVQKGVYAGLSGPSLETPAETRFLKTIGSDAVGFSTVMEAIAGTHAGMKILGLSLITNLNDPDNPVPTTLESVLETAQKASGRLGMLASEVIYQMPDHYL